MVHNIREIPPLFPLGAQAPRMSAVLLSPSPDAAKLPMPRGTMLVKPGGAEPSQGTWLAPHWQQFDCWEPGAWLLRDT